MNLSSCTVIDGDCLDVMRGMEDNSISCIVTDPPYGLGFMNKAWDAGLPHDQIWLEALRVTKPGGMMLCFGGTRTYHRLTCAIEDAGWEIRDCMMWLYGSGFTKSHNFGKKLGGEWSGYGTALKPSFEPIIVCMKPCDGTFAQNAEKWGQAGINIDACRIRRDESDVSGWSISGSNESENVSMSSKNYARSPKPDAKGRWPANIILDEYFEETGKQVRSSDCSAAALDEMSGINASRFFYCAKASSSERNEGLGEKKSTHPTVKPLKLMEYLIKLVMPPKDGVLLDPFAGSGSSIVAAQNLGYKAIGIEKQKEYADIARARIHHAKQKYESKPVQLELFA